MTKLRRLFHWCKTLMPVRVMTAYGQSNGSNYAAALAFGVLLTMFPMMLGLLAIIGLATNGNPALQSQFENALLQGFPPDSRPQLLDALTAVQRSAGLFGLLSIAGLIYGGMGMFASMEFALAEIFGVKQRDAVRQRLMGVVMMLVFVAGISVSLGANFVIGMLPRLPYLGIAVGALVMIALVTAIYRFVPNRSFSLREILPGAVVAGLLIQLLSLAFPLYSTFSHGFNSYGKQFSLFFLIATWVYLLSQLLLIGAIFNRIRLPATATLGLIATPDHEARRTVRPIDAVHRQKQVAGD